MTTTPTHPATECAYCLQPATQKRWHPTLGRSVHTCDEHDIDARPITPGPTGCPTCGGTDHSRCWSSPAAMIEARR